MKATTDSWNAISFRRCYTRRRQISAISRCNSRFPDLRKWMKNANSNWKVHVNRILPWATAIAQSLPQRRRSKAQKRNTIKQLWTLWSLRWFIVRILLTQRMLHVNHPRDDSVCPTVHHERWLQGDSAGFGCDWSAMSNTKLSIQMTIPLCCRSISIVLIALPFLIVIAQQHQVNASISSLPWI